MTQDAGSHTASPQDSPQDVPAGGFPPPPWPLGDEQPLPKVTRTPLVLRIVLTVIAVLFVGPGVQGLLDPSSVAVDGNPVPGWLGVLLLLGLLLIGWLALAFAWVNKVVVDRHSVAVDVLGMRTRVDLTSAQRITAVHRVVAPRGAAAAFLPRRAIVLSVTSTTGRHVEARTDLNDTGPLTEVLVRWWYARPDLVQDRTTAEILAQVAAHLASHP